VKLNRNRKIILIFLVIVLSVNETYRFIEYKRLKSMDCEYVNMSKTGESVSIDPSSSLNEYKHVYICKDGVQTSSPYNITKRVRPWEK